MYNLKLYSATLKGDYRVFSKNNFLNGEYPVREDFSIAFIR